LVSYAFVPQWNWVMNCLHKSLKELIEPGCRFSNHCRAGPFSMMGKAWHMISFRFPVEACGPYKYQCGPRDPWSHCTWKIWGILNFRGSGNSMTLAVKGRFMPWRRLSTVECLLFIGLTILSNLACKSSRWTSTQLSAS
jgi:hypothetical protein